jgi:hypothetical protein
MRRLSCVTGLMMLALALVGAPTPAAAQDVPAVEVSGGYNFLRVFDDELEGEENFPKGWYADVAGNITPTLGVVGALFGTYKTIEDVDFSVHGFMAGVRLSGRNNPTVVPFGEVLVGAARSKAEFGGFDESETDGLLQLGGGVNFIATTNVGVRVGAAYVRVFSEDEGTNVLRFTAGLVLGFGSR